MSHPVHYVCLAGQYVPAAPDYPVYYKHFNFKQWDKSYPAVTTAYRFLGTGELEIAASRCSRKDSFSKVKGRAISLTRLLAGDSIVISPPRVKGRLFEFDKFLWSVVRHGELVLKNKSGETQSVKVNSLY
jgi:hypothetical protein